MPFVLSSRPYVQLPSFEKAAGDVPQESFTPRQWASGIVWLIATAAIAFFAGAIFGVELYLLPNVKSNEPGAMKSFVPEMPTKSVTFSMKSSLMGAPSYESDKAWEDLIPVGYGFVNISDPETYHLPPGVEAESGPDIYSVAMFHQIHCLTHIRDRYWLLVNGIMDPSTLPKIQPEVEKEVRFHHTQHCLEYLAQSISCSADLTIEWGRLNKDGHRVDVDGGGVPHTCKDPDAIWAWMEANHGPPSKQSHSHVHLSNLLSD